MILQQNYAAYTDQDHQVWQLLYRRQFQNLQDKAVPAVLESLARIRPALHGDAVPEFGALSALLAAATGWTITVVPGLIPVEDFFALLAQRRFPSSTWLRRLDQLDYLEEPDMFHDIFGHIPLLMDAPYADFMQRFGQLGLTCLDQPQWVAALERLYWFTIEFGVCGSVREGLHLLGAGILSSFGESNQIYQPDACLFRPFDTDTVLRHVFYKHQMQAVYYLLPDYHALFSILQTIEKQIQSGVNIACV